MLLWIGAHLPLLALETFQPLPAAAPSDNSDGLGVLEQDHVIALDRPAVALSVVADLRLTAVSNATRVPR
ncbi:hypothetical protein WJ03_07035 [Burkholderia vietnamiensis]|nr:hypothetical protein WJ03_07035 [Burkholderia vietnamiensis]